jgi:hypothetical protein
MIRRGVFAVHILSRFVSAKNLANLFDPSVPGLSKILRR